MALESVFAKAPPKVGHANKDTQNGEIESSTEPDDGFEIDLEEGEIVDSGKEDSDEDSKTDVGEKPGVGEGGAQSRNAVSKASPLRAAAAIRMDKKKKKSKRKKEGFVGEEPRTKIRGSYFMGHEQGEEDEEWFSPTSSPMHRPSHHHHHGPGLHDYSPGPFEDPFMRSPCDSPDSGGILDHHGGLQPGGGPFHAGGRGGRRKGPPHPMDKRAALLLKKKKKKLKPGGEPMGGPPHRGRGGRPSKRGEGGGGPPSHKGNRSICKFYLDSKCLKGADCPFSHDAPVPRKQDLCKFYLSGYCARGENCSFMHEDFPCKFFHTGAKCYADTHCRFSHAPLDDEKQQLLQRYLDSHGSRMDDYAPDDCEGPMRGPHHPSHHHRTGGDGPPNSPHHRNGSPMRGDCGGPRDRDQEEGDEDEIAPPPAKRPSLLGSPPRHVKEAAESWRMQFLGGPGVPMGGFGGRPMGPMGPLAPHMMSPPRGGMPPFVRPNSFYVDTMQQSPLRGGLMAPSMTPPHLMMSPQGPCIEEDFPHMMGGGPPGGFRSPSISSPPLHDQGQDREEKDSAAGNDGSRTLQPTTIIPNAASTASDHHSQSASSPPHQSSSSTSTAAAAAAAAASGIPGLTLLSGLLASVGESLAKAGHHLPGLAITDPESSPAATGGSDGCGHEEQGKDSEMSQQSSTETSSPTLDGAAPAAMASPPTATETAVLPPNLPRRQRELFLRIQQQQKEQQEAEAKEAEAAKNAAGEDGRRDEAEDEEEDREEESRRDESSDDDEDFDDDRPLTAVLKKLQQQSTLPTETKEPSTSVPAPTTSSPATTSTTTSSVSTGAIDIAKMLSSIRQQVPSQPQTDFWKQLFSSTVQPTTTAETAVQPSQPTPSSPASRDPRRARAAAAAGTGPTKVEQPPTSRDPRLRHDRPHQTPKPEVAYIESKDGDAPYKLRTIFRASPDYNAVVQSSAVDSAMRNDPRLAKHLAAKEEKQKAAAAAALTLAAQAAPVVAVPKPAAPVAPQPALLPTPQLPNTIETVVKPVVSRDPRVARHLEQQSKVAASDPRRAAKAADPAPQPSLPPQVTMPLLHNPPLLNAPPGLVGVPGQGLLPAPPGILPNPHLVVPAPVPTRIDPRLARRLEQQKAKEPEKPVENKEAAEKPAPPASRDPRQKEKGKKEKKGRPAGGDKRKGRMDYASPLSSYDEGDRPAGYSAYQRRPQPRPAPVPPAASSTSTPSSTNVPSAADPVPAATLMPPPPTPPLPAALPMTPLPMSITPNELLFDDEQEMKSLKEVFKTKDPTASPFC